MLTLFLTAVALYFFQPEETPEPLQKVTRTFQKILTGRPATSGDSTLSEAGAPKAEVNAQAEVIELKKWISVQAAEMETKRYDPLVAEAQMIEKARNLTLPQIELIQELVLNVEASSSANERILGLYLLSKAQNNALPALKKIATAPLSKPGPHEAHSLDETLSMHEKALRRIAIDDFFKRATLDPSLKESLFKMIQSIEVPELKTYALNRYQQQYGYHQD